MTASQVVVALQGAGILCGEAASERVRFVTHLDVEAEAVRTAGEIAARVLLELSSAAERPTRR